MRSFVCYICKKEKTSNSRYKTEFGPKCQACYHREYLSNKDKRSLHLERCKSYRENNKEKRRLSTSAYSQKHRRFIYGKYNHRIQTYMRSSLLSHLSNENQAGGLWQNYVDYSVSELKKHLESKFSDGMTWERFIKGEIQIDHVIPKSNFKYNSPMDELFLSCWKLSNLQPLWKEDNLRKYNKVTIGEKI